MEARKLNLLKVTQLFKGRTSRFLSTDLFNYKATTILH